MKPALRRFVWIAIPFVFPAILLALLLIVFTTAPAAAGAHSAADSVTRAWELANASGAYGFRTALVQTTDPALSLTNAGRGQDVYRLFVDGAVDRPANRLTMDLWQNSRAAQALSVKVENGQTFGRVGETEWQEIENIGDMFAPGGDPLGFLSGAANIQYAGTQSRNFSGPDNAGLTVSYEVYTFVFDGGRFAAHMQAQMEAALRARGALPAGMHASLPDEYRKMTGTGEIWLDADGLPRYVQVDLALPARPNGDRVTAVIESELFDFDLARIEAAQATFLGDASTWLAARLPANPEARRALAVNVGMWAFIAAGAVLALRHWHSRKLYAGLAGALIFSMVFTPLIQSAQAASRYEDQQARQQEQDAARAQAEEQAEARDYLQTPGNPHQNPLETPSQYALEQTVAKVFDEPYAFLPDEPFFAIQSSGTITTTDSDDDGLSDADEAEWQTCAYAGAPDNCTGVADPTDSDGDGLSDGDEVNRVGSVPTLIDTDGDSITDTVEVEGYTDANGVDWYLDAYESDSNKDGMLDGSECPAWSNTAANPAPGSACPDTDGDGTPDIYDDDNDGDGVEDGVDTSPLTPASETYNQDNPFSLNISGLALDTPVFVNFQVRPTDPAHLNYFGLVMDWPSGDDEGQVQRVLDTTWANTSDTSAQGTGDDAGYGDMRLVPYLEITIPYASGHYGNLPVLPAYEGTTRSLNDSVDDWLDTSVTDAYGISVQDVDSTSGDLVVYVPLTTVSDRNGGGDVAFAARMLYWPSQGSGGLVDWGSDHSYRIAWFVQMLTDACPDNDTDCDDSERVEEMSVIHVYDEDWRLTGLDIVEDRGLDVGILYEDPSQDTNLDADAQLWNASWLLGDTFLRGKDCPMLSGNACNSGAQDDERDVTIANALAQLEGWASAAGDTSYLAMETFSYEHEGFLAHIMMTETVSLLETEFSSYADDTTPTLLFLTERTRRTFNLDDGTLSGGLLAPDFDPAGTDNDVPEVVMAGMSWATYYDADDTAGMDWQTYDPYDYIELLDWQLQTDDYFTAVSNEADDIAEAEGKRLWAQVYYIALYSGQIGLVEVNGSTAWAENPDIPEVASSSWPFTTFYGFSYVAFTFFTALVSATVVAASSTVSFWRSLKYAFSYGLSFYTSSVTRSLKAATAVTFVMVAAVAILIVVGMTLFIVGFFTGNEELIQTAVIILNVATIIVLAAWLFSILRTIVQIIRVSMLATNSMRVFFGLTSALAKSSRAIGVAGLIIAIAVAWGFFIYSIISGKIKPGTVEFEIALAYVIAQTIVMIILFLFEIVFSIVGTIILLLLLIVDAILALAGEQGVIDWLTEQIAREIYDVDYVIFNLDDPERLDFDFAGVALSDPEGGFTTANGLYVSMTVTTTLDVHGNNDGKRATFRYEITQAETDIHASLDQNTMNGEWDKEGDYILAVQTAVNETPIPLSAAGTGINVNLSDNIYLNEGAVIPYEGCWRIPIYTEFGAIYIDVDCTWYDTKYTNHIGVGEYQVFDILPETIGDFVGLGWSDAFPPQSDHDNDGMLSEDMGGTDPNDSNADMDNDGLSDTYELSIGTDPEQADSDHDGLTDPRELTRRTDPLSADTDGDGLDDYTEAVVGWLVVYDDQNHLTRVWSDPGIADADNDTLTDLEEFVFGFNPWTATDPSIISNLIAFDNLNVSETNAPLMLFEFEEPSGSEIFNDDFGRGYTAACTGTACPASGAAGNFGSAVDFDGLNDIISVPNVDLAGSFTLAGWFNRDNNPSISPLVSFADLSVSVYSQRVTCAFGSNSVESTTYFFFLTGEWHHWACVFDAEAETLSVYIDGALEASTGTTSVFDGTGTLQLGSQPFLLSNLWLNGRLDEVSVYPSALSPSQIADLVDQKYVINDLLVAPGDPLTYQATVSNTHPSQSADGLMTADTHYIDPAIGVPDVVLGFEADEKISAFTDSVGQSTTATCISDSTCPATGADGQYNSAIEFDGVDDYIILPVVGKDLDEYTLAFWFYPTSTPVTNTYLLDTESTEPGALDIYVKPDGKMVFDIAGGEIDFICRRDLNNNLIDCTSDPGSLPDKPETAFTFIGSNLNQWWFIGVIGDADSANVYINPDDGDSSQLSFSVAPTGDPIEHAYIGPGRIGNDLEGAHPYEGRMDDFIFYNQQVASPTSTNNKELSQKVYKGTYNFDYVGYSAKQVNFLIEFDELGVEYDATSFFDTQTSSDNAYCESTATCPALTPDGYSGYGLEFDGVDDYAAIYGSVYQTGMDLTLYVYPSDLPDSGKVMYLFDSTSSGNDWLDIYFDSAGIVYVGRSGSSTARACFSPCASNLLLQEGEWNKIYLNIEFRSQSGIYEYAYDFWINDNEGNSSNWCSGSFSYCNGKQSRIGAGWLGGKSTSSTPATPSGLTGVVPFEGIMDELSLVVGTYPFDLDPMEIGFVNAMNDGVTAHCPDTFGCPESVSGGAFGNAVQFDGVDDYLYHDQVDFVKGDYTISGWFKVDPGTADQTILAATDPDNANNIGVLLSIGTQGRLRWRDRFPSGSSGGALVTSDTGYHDGQWHHFVVIKNGTDMTMILDGANTHTGTTSGYGDGYYDLSIGAQVSSLYLAGYIDELIIIPSAAADGTYYYAAQTLMDAPYPPISIEADFTPFDIPALSSVTVAGSAAVDGDAVNSQHQFNQEVEAALQLQSVLSYPIIDSLSADLVVFLPFEEVPGETTFINYGENGFAQEEADFTCDDASGYCPQAGLRGKVGRALFFDGVDDQVSVGTGSNASVNTIAAWVYGDHGTVVQTNWYGGMELDFNRFRVWWTDIDDGIEDSSITFEIPENQWTHLAGTYDHTTGALALYINGALAGTATLTPSTVVERTIDSIGANMDGSDPFHGYIDDLRAYDVVLTAAQVATLYAESTALLHFEFDEDENASFFADKSINELIGEPLSSTCYAIQLDSMTINGLAVNPSSVLIALDDALLSSTGDAAPGGYELDQTTLLCASGTLEISVSSGGSSTSLGTTSAAAAPGAYSHTFTSGGNNIQLDWTVDSDPILSLNPSPGTDGKIGNTALFDGNGYLTVDGADDVNGITNTLTIMMWIMPDDASDRQRFVASARTTSINGFGFGLDGANLLFTTWGIQDYLATSTEVEANIWQHVAVVFDSAYDARFYVDGVLKQTVLGSLPISANHDDLLMIGGTTTQLGSTLEEMFSGQIDELQIYNRSLSGAEIFAFYLRELRWYRDRNASLIQVDADAPSVERLGGGYYANGEIDLVVSAVDATSSVRYLDYAIKAPSDAGYSAWQSADLCADSDTAGRNAVWCLTFDSSTLDGEGQYDLKFRAYDAVGNLTEISDSIWVDATPPTVSAAYSGQWRQVTDDPNVELAWTLEITGTVSDPDIGGNPGSGVLTATQSATQTIQIALYDSNGDIAGEGAVMAQAAGGVFAAPYRFTGQPPHGAYTLAVSAQDNAGNAAETLINPAFKLDARAPSVEMNLWYMTDTITTSFTLSGTVFDAIDAGGSVAQYHFEETGSTFRDHSYEGNHALCGFCPATGAAGVFGSALGFTADSQAILIPPVINPISGTFSAALWVRPDNFSAARTLLSQQDGLGTGRAWLWLDTSGNLNSSLGGVTLTGSAPLAAGAWSHVALTYDGLTLRLFVNAALVAEASRTMETNEGPFWLGADKDGISNTFRGRLDEFSLFNRALTASDVYALAQAENAGVQSVDVWVETFPFTGALGTPNWDAAALTGSAGDDLAGWEYDLPGGLEDYYRIHLQGTDTFGNTGSQQRVWRGIIDTLAPRTALSVTVDGYGSAASTTYDFTIVDNFLDEDTLVTPCDTSSAPFTFTYHPQTGLLTGAAGSCRVNGINAGASVSVEACDLWGHCSSEDETVPAGAPESAVLIRDPEAGAVIGRDFASGAGIPVEVGAFAAAGSIEMLSLSDQNGWIDGLLLSGTVTDTLWTSYLWLPASAGTYTLTAIMTDTLGGAYTDTAVVTLVPFACFAEIDGDGVTDFMSLDASAAQDAVDAVTAGGTVRLSGDCAGVQTLGGETQTLYIDRSVSVEGGYDETDWLAGPNPAVFPTTLDAGGAGRVVYATGITNTVALLNLNLINGLAADGAGVYNAAQMTIFNSTIAGNLAAGDGGGIYNAHVLLLGFSTVSGNQADAGGGLYNAYVIGVFNSTLDGNTAASGAGFLNAGISASVNQATITDNTGEGIANLGATLTVGASVLAGNDVNCSGSITDDGYNLDDGTTCGFSAAGSVSGADALLGALADNGGSTLTRLPLPFSPLIDAIAGATCLAGPDQTGTARPVDGACDIGAVELSLNYTPTAASETYTTDEDVPLAAAAPGVLANDTDGDWDTLTPVLDADVLSGTLNLLPDGSFTYTPTLNTCGDDRFAYHITDEAAASSTVTVTLTVDCLPPAADAGGPYDVDEGGSVLLDGSGSSEQPAALAYEWDFDYNGLTFTADAAGATTLFNAVDGGDLRTLALRVTDGSGLSNLVTTTLTIHNVAPLVDAGPDQTLYLTTTVNFAGSFSDPGVLDTHEILWDFGDGVTLTGSLTPTHHYAAYGTYTATLTVSDNDGGAGSDTVIIRLYDGPDLVLDKDDGGAAITFGTTVTYTLAYTNAGGLPADNVVITETVPLGTRFDASANPPGWTGCYDGAPAGTICTYNLGTLNPGAGGSLTFAVRPPLSSGGAPFTIQNTAKIGDDRANGPEANPADNTASDTTPVQNVIAHVAAIWMVDASAASYYRANYTFVIVNQFGQGVDGLTFHGNLIAQPDGQTGPYTKGTTGGGLAYKWSRARNPGTFTVCAVNVTGPGVTYNAAANVETCDSLTLPLGSPVLPGWVFAGSDQTGFAGAPLQFNGVYLDPDEPGNTVSIHWDFGDGTTSQGSLTPVKVYAAPGVYTVTLTITDDGGVQSSTITVTVLAGYTIFLPVISRP